MMTHQNNESQAPSARYLPYKKTMSFIPRRLSAAQFDATIKFLRLSEKRSEAARRVMVNGESGIAVAAENDWTRNNVSNLVKQVWQQAVKLNLVVDPHINPAEVKQQRRLTQDQFDETCSHLRMTEDRVKAARLVLVLGQPAVTVAEDFQWSRANVSAVAKKVWDMAIQLGLVVDGDAPSDEVDDILPDGWDKRSFVAPVELLERWTLELSNYGTSPSVAAAPSPARRSTADRAVASTKKTPARNKAAR